VLSNKGVSFFFDSWELKLLGDLDDVDAIEDGDFALKNIKISIFEVIKNFGQVFLTLRKVIEKFVAALSCI
jgi:hypothetical protein